MIVKRRVVDIIRYGKRKRKVYSSAFFPEKYILHKGNPIPLSSFIKYIDNEGIERYKRKDKRRISKKEKEEQLQKKRGEE
jgi:hypothetical protein